jgi:hypothetical protein
MERVETFTHGADGIGRTLQRRDVEELPGRRERLGRFPGGKKSLDAICLELLDAVGVRGRSQDGQQAQIRYVIVTLQLHQPLEPARTNQPDGVLLIGSKHFTDLINRFPLVFGIIAP